MQPTSSATPGYQLTVTDLRGERTFCSSSIVRLEVADNYTVIHFNNQQRPFTVSKVLKVYETMLSPYGFIRLHRSHLVNTQFITEVHKSSIVMEDTSVIRVAKRKKNVRLLSLLYKVICKAH